MNKSNLIKNIIIDDFICDIIFCISTNGTFGTGYLSNIKEILMKEGYQSDNIDQKINEMLTLGILSLDSVELNLISIVQIPKSYYNRT